MSKVTTSKKLGPSDARYSSKEQVFEVETVANESRRSVTTWTISQIESRIANMQQKKTADMERWDSRIDELEKLKAELEAL